MADMQSSFQLHLDTWLGAQSAQSAPLPLAIYVRRVGRVSAASSGHPTQALVFDTLAARDRCFVLSAGKFH